ncbi:hypothetical protein U1Q18_014799 [Sarracenia purpurea var. burkii]
MQRSGFLGYQSSVEQRRAQIRIEASEGIVWRSEKSNPKIEVISVQTDKRVSGERERRRTVARIRRRIPIIVGANQRRRKVF